MVNLFLVFALFIFTFIKYWNVNTANRESNLYICSLLQWVDKIDPRGLSRHEKSLCIQKPNSKVLVSRAQRTDLFLPIIKNSTYFIHVNSCD